MGHGADRPDLLLQPYELLELYPLLVWIKQEKLDPQGVNLFPGNNIGYFGPYESLLRYGGDKGAHWQGCSAGKWTLGLEADGKIKGCPSLPSEVYTGGNIRDRGIADAIRNAPEIYSTQRRTKDDLWGFCHGCYYADVCKAGCTWTSHVLLGKPGNNPYCIHRAMQHEAAGQRERLYLAEMAPGLPFDNGRYGIVVEELDALPVQPDAAAETILGWPLQQVLNLDWRSGGIWEDEAMFAVLAGKSRKAGRTTLEGRFRPG
jgi:radical SAM protein with 4Fe4S-binding SPASM domain